MKPSFLVILSSLTLIVCSCSPIIKLIYGIHQPKFVDSGKLTHAINKHKLDTSNNFAIKGNEYFYVVNKTKMTYPEIIVFNQAGKYLKYKSVQECNASAFKFIDSLNNNKNYPIIDTFLLEKFENSLVDFQGKKKESIINKTTDFYVLIFWAEWTGKLNKDHTYIWEQKAKNNKNCNIKTIKINCDFQSFWEESEKKNVINTLSAKKS